jgi:hypothetical protein
MVNVLVTVPAGVDYADASHSIGHTNYDVVPIPLSLGQTFLITAKTASAFTLTVSDTELSSARVFTCIIVEGTVPTATGVTTDLVRAVFKGLASTDDINNTQLTQFIVDATATVNLKAGTTIDYTTATGKEFIAVRNLAAVYAYCMVTGLSASGMAFQIGDFIHVIDKLPSNVQFVLNEALGIIAMLSAAASTDTPFYLGQDTS